MIRTRTKTRRSGRRGRPRRPTTRATTRWPSWRELARRESVWADQPRGVRFSARRLTLYVVMAAALFTAYVWHVYATREALREVQRLRREHLQLVLEYNRLKGEFDRATSPAVIYERARALGLVEGFTYGPVVIRVQP